MQAEHGFLPVHVAIVVDAGAGAYVRAWSADNSITANRAIRMSGIFIVFQGLLTQPMVNASMTGACARSSCIRSSSVFANSSSDVGRSCWTCVFGFATSHHHNDYQVG